MLYVKNVCKYQFIFTPYFRNWCLKRHIVEYDKLLGFSREMICNAVCEECVQISTLYLPLIFPNGVRRHVVVYDKFRFLPKILCNAVCEECLQISIYIYPLLAQMVSNNMLLRTMNSDFSQNSFIMLYVKIVCIYLFIFTHYFLNWFQTRHIVDDTINSDFSQKSFVMLCEECLQISIYIYPLFSQMVSQTTCCWRMINLLFQREIICNVVCEECLQISIYMLPLIFAIGEKRHIVE